jgi:uroporphyrinogen III methyltransferase/synthase
MKSRPVVIVTRPVEQAAGWVQQLQQWGYETFLFPVLAIEPVVWSEPTRTHLHQLNQFDFVHFSSPNAIHYALQPLGKNATLWASSAHIGLMGSGSRALMRRWYPESAPQWISPPEEGAWDSETLIQVMARQPWLKDLRRALLVKGQGGREVLADWLRSHSIEVQYAEVYARQPLQFTPETEAKLHSLRDMAQCIWLLTSSEGSQALGKIIRRLSDGELQQKLWHASVLTTHERVAWAAHQAGFEQVISCLPGEQALKAALESLHD